MIEITLAWEQVFVCTLVLGVFLAFVFEWASPDLVAMTAFVLLLFSGILGKEELEAVFGSKALIIIACMFILSVALERTGAIEALGNLFNRLAGTGHTRILVVLMLLVAPLSGIVNNTPVVVVFMPIVLKLCRQLGLTASHFLIPLSYAAIVGGTCTTIGTSTNVVATSKAEQIGKEKGIAGLEAFGMFEITALGLVFVAVTMCYMLTIGRRLLPDRVTLSTLFDSEEGREFLTQATVSADSPMVGKVFTQTKLAKKPEMRLIEVLRGGKRLDSSLDETEIKEGDVLVFKTRVSGILDLEQNKGVDLLGQEEHGLEGLQSESAMLMEGIIGPRSTLVGRTLKDLNFRQRFGVIILAVHRRGVNLREKIQDVRLAFGDTLLVEGPADSMKKLFDQKDFVNLSQPAQRAFRRTKAPIAVAAIAGFVLFGAFNKFIPGQPPLELLAMTAVLLVLLTKCIEPREAYRAIEWKVIFMILGMLGMGQALENTGLAEQLALLSVDVFGKWGPQIVLAVIYLLAAILTEIISNTAVAALLTPIAIGVAVSLDVDPRAFVVAVMFGSSASFATPIGYQTNTYVYGAGGYKFVDFCKVGIPLTITLWLIASLLIPLLWPLTK